MVHAVCRAQELIDHDLMFYGESPVEDPTDQWWEFSVRRPSGFADSKRWQYEYGGRFFRILPDR